MNAATTYHRRALEGATPVGLIVLLYQAAVVSLRRGIAAMEAGDIEVRTQALNRVLALVGELKASLNYDRGGEVALQFARFYQLADRLVMQASFQQDAQPLRDLLDPMVQIRDAWQQVDALPVGKQFDRSTGVGEAAAGGYAQPQPPSGGVRSAWEA
ncbi:MAG TPA: flagellar export chaperone FliS [Terriglobales bacterium]|nr:flagellar export chaperone FliS [Terriglobales bacterium]